MMRNCEKCNENIWSYTFVEGWIIATCQFCGNAVEFGANKKNGKRAGRLSRELYAGDKCRNCGGALIEKPTKATQKRLTKSFYYSRIIKCKQCRAIYLQERFKVINKYENALM